ncbi:MAG: hypothetical protein KC547_09185, partial [Anaerolineae bacterium]|nr:hypothetical protein [Anaerolineae bacterium]
MFNRILLSFALLVTILVGSWAVIYAQDSAERVFISSPAPGSTLSGMVQVSGSAVSDNIRGIILYVVGSDGNIVDRIATARPGDFAVSWNTTLLPNGEYTLALAVITPGRETTAFTVPYLTVLNEASPTSESSITPTPPASAPAVDAAQTMILDTAIPNNFPDEIPTPYVPPFTDNTANLPQLEVAYEIAYITDNDERPARYTLDLSALDGSYSTRLVSEQRSFLDLGWSPDGTRVAYVLDADLDAPGALCLVYADTGQTRCFEEYENQGTAQHDELSDADYAAHFAWSPDGTQIAYKLRGEAKSDMRIRILDPDSGDIRTIATVDGWFDNPLFWIGDAIYFKGNRISPNGEVTIISETLNDAAIVWYSPDGRYAIFTQYTRGEDTRLCLHKVATDTTLQCLTMSELLDTFGHGRRDAYFLSEVVFSPDQTRVGIVLAPRDEEARWYVYSGYFYSFVLGSDELIPMPFEFEGYANGAVWHPNNNAVIGGNGNTWYQTTIYYQSLNGDLESIVFNDEEARTTLVALRPSNFRPNTVTVHVDPNIDAQIQLDNGAGVYIPAGSLSGEADVIIEQNPPKAYSLPPIAEGMVPVSNFYDVRVEGAELLGPVALSFPIDNESLPLPPDATPFFLGSDGQAALPTAEPTLPPLLMMVVPNDEGTDWNYVPLSEPAHRGTQRVTVWTDTLFDPLIAWHYPAGPTLPKCTGRFPLMVIPDLVQPGDEATLVGQVLPLYKLVNVPIVEELSLDDVSNIAVTVHIMGSTYIATTDEEGRFALAIPGSLTEAMAPQGNYVINRTIRAEAACNGSSEADIHDYSVEPSVGWATLRVAPHGEITPTHTFTPTSTATATATPLPCEVRTNGDVQVRVAPDRTVVRFMERGVWVPVLGQGGEDNSWWRVEPSIAAPDAQIYEAWIEKGGVEIRGNCAGGFVSVQAPPPIVPFRITITPTPSPTGVVSEDRTYLVDFTIEPGVITEGQCTTLNWNAPEAVSAALEGVPVVTSGSRQECPTVSRRYAFSVQLPDGTQETRVVLVEVLPAEPDAPAILVSINFGATDQTIRQGECTTVYWSAEGIESVYYQGQPAIGQGESRECPMSTT